MQGWCKHPLKLLGSEVDNFALSGPQNALPQGHWRAVPAQKLLKIGPVFGGGGQERGLRPGTENVPYIVTLGAAAQAYGKTILPRLAAAQQLNLQLRGGLAELPGVVLNSPAEASPYVCNFSLPGVRSGAMLHYLEQQGNLCFQRVGLLERGGQPHADGHGLARAAH